MFSQKSQKTDRWTQYTQANRKTDRSTSQDLSTLLRKNNINFMNLLDN